MSEDAKSLIEVEARAVDAAHAEAQASERLTSASREASEAAGELTGLLLDPPF